MRNRCALLLLIAGSTACTVNAPPRDIPPDQVIPKAVNQFALDLYKVVSAKPGNLFFSPYSISAALGMTSAGARGKTLEEINKVFHFPKEGPHAGFKTLEEKLTGRDKAYELNVANRLWLQEGSPYYPSFKDLLKTNYGAEAGPGSRPNGK